MMPCLLGVCWGPEPNWVRYVPDHLYSHPAVLVVGIIFVLETRLGLTEECHWTSPGALN